MDRYTKIERRGEGAFGKVYKARDSQTGDVVALKIIKCFPQAANIHSVLSPGDNETETQYAKEGETVGHNIGPIGIPAALVREIAVLKELRHSCVVNLRDVMHAADGGKVALVFDFFESDLRRHLDAQRERMANSMLAVVAEKEKQAAQTQTKAQTSSAAAADEAKGDSPGKRGSSAASSSSSSSSSPSSSSSDSTSDSDVDNKKRDGDDVDVDGEAAVGRRRVSKPRRKEHGKKKKDRRAQKKNEKRKQDKRSSDRKDSVPGDDSETPTATAGAERRESAADTVDAGMAIPLPTLRTLLRQLLSGVAYCHQLRIMHRDLKVSFPNVLLLPTPPCCLLPIPPSCLSPIFIRDLWTPELTIILTRNRNDKAR
jgi:hypothetical protein